MEDTPGDRATTKSNGNSPFLLTYPEAAILPTLQAKVFFRSVGGCLKRSILNGSGRKLQKTCRRRCSKRLGSRIFWKGDSHA
jgi:hypothetical protein